MEAVMINKKTISHSDSNICGSIWRVKQLNKAYDKEKLSILGKYRSKGRRKVLSSLPSNLLATSISPMTKSIRHSISIDS
jgi:hypothetical protein